MDALRPRTLVELGTHSGLSYSAFAQAVQALGIDTSCYAIDTWKGDEHAGFYGGEKVFAEWSAFHDRYFGGFSRLIRSTFDEALTHFSDRSMTPCTSMDSTPTKACATTSKHGCRS